MTSIKTNLVGHHYRSGCITSIGVHMHQYFILSSMMRHMDTGEAVVTNDKLDYCIAGHHEACSSSRRVCIHWYLYWIRYINLIWTLGQTVVTSNKM